MVLLVSYDRTTDGRPEKFDVLDAAINGAATDTQRPSRSVWLVHTDEDVSVWGPRLGELLEPEDRMVIVRIPNMASVNGWLPRVHWEWIGERVG